MDRHAASRPYPVCAPSIRLYHRAAAPSHFAFIDQGLPPAPPLSALLSLRGVDGIRGGRTLFRGVDVELAAGDLLRLQAGTAPARPACCACCAG